MRLHDASAQMAVEMSEEKLTGGGGTALHLRSWPLPNPRASIVLCHGVNSHGGQYLWVASQLVAAGFAAYACDHRGRGRSEGPRFLIADVSEYTEDLGQVIALAHARAPDRPVFLLGHSAGGVISCTWLLDHPSGVAGFICESFAFEVPAPAPVLALVRWLGRVAPKLPALKLKMADFTRDAEALRALEADPLTRGEVQPAGTVAALLRAGDRMRREFSTVQLPLLIMHGTADRATVPEGSRRFYDAAGSSDKTLKLYEGHFHDLLNDLGKERVMADVVHWINARVR